MTRKTKIAVFASGSGSNFGALKKHVEMGNLMPKLF